MKYLHIVSISFPVLSKYADGCDIKPDMYQKKIKQTIADLDAIDGWSTATKIIQTYSLEEGECRPFDDPEEIKS